MSNTDLQAHDDLQARIWSDDRMTPGTREVALAMAWVLHHRAGAEPFDWTRLRHMLGHDGHVTRGGQGWRLHDLIAGDAPRYEPPRDWYGGECEGPRLRPYKPRGPAYPGVTIRDFLPAPDERDHRICGSHGTIHVIEKDMVTGWETVHTFCSRHRQRAAEVKAMLAARGVPPEPIPNAGGTLPRYFAANWAAVYARACERSKTSRMFGWDAPYHGVDADDWPVPGKTLIPKRPRLSLVASA